MDNNKNIIGIIKSNTKYRAILFFTFYFIFFCILISAIKSNNSIKTTTNKYLFSIDNIGNKYHFKYTLDIDNNEVFYEGDVFNNSSKFTNVSSGELYKEQNNIFFKYDGSTWINIDSPYLMVNYKYDVMFDKIINNATYISKIENADSTKIYNYQISTTTLYKLFDLNVIDLDDLPNSMTIYTNSNNELIKVKYDFSSYFKYKKKCLDSLFIEVEYSN